MSDLKALFNPRSIAILGASTDFRKVNGRPLRNLLAKGYGGKIFPVNPKYQAIGDLPCYPAVADLPESPTSALSATSARSASTGTRSRPPAAAG